MFIFVDHNHFTKEIKEKFKHLNYTPILLYSIIYKSKNQFKQDYVIICEKKKRFQGLSAIQLKLETIDNSVPGVINSFKQQFDLIIGCGGLNKINRFLVEQTSINILQDPQNEEQNNRFDFIHHHNTGMNQILFKLAKEKNILLLLTLNSISNGKKMGRYHSLVKLATKFKVPIISSFIINRSSQFKTKEELKGISSVLGISSQQNKFSLKAFDKLIRKKQSQDIISSGIMFLK